MKSIFFSKIGEVDWLDWGGLGGSEKFSHNPNCYGFVFNWGGPLEDAKLALEDELSVYIFGTGINVKRDEIVFKLFLHNFR